MPRRPKPRRTPKPRTRTTKPRKPPQRRATPTALVPATRDKIASHELSLARRSTKVTNDWQIPEVMRLGSRNRRTNPHSRTSHERSNE